MPGYRALPMDAFAVLVAPTTAGIAWMAYSGAPLAWIAINAGALVLALGLAVLLPIPDHAQGRLILASALVIALFATAFAGVPIDGVQRWIALGPVRLHAGYLVVPLLVVLAGRLPSRPAAALLVAALCAILLQPDRAVTFALAATMVLIALRQRDVASLLGAGLAIAGCVAALLMADPLGPVRFVENVQRDAWQALPAAGLFLTLVTLAPLLLRRSHSSAAPLAAFLVVAGLMAFAGAYPSILIGYGAAPILGVGLALAALQRPAIGDGSR